jgi:predicted metal-dependent phosphoesterase TrpH
VIDLHLHTTASDGRLSPAELVGAARAAGLTVIAITDHDTTGGIAAARDAARPSGLTVISGIEITAVHQGRDVHVLGYFLEMPDRELNGFLDAQRADRRRRLDEMVARLAGLGAPLRRPLPGEAGDEGRAVGRPHVARALVEAGHAASIADAFDRFIGEDGPAYVPRRGVPPADVIARIARAGGLASLAHPGKSRRDDLDDLIDGMIAAGLAAIEAYHPDHTPADSARYRRLAADRGLAVSGGSDYHGPGSGRADALGRVTLPAEEFSALAARAGGRLA